MTDVMGEESDSVASEYEGGSPNYLGRTSDLEGLFQGLVQNMPNELRAGVREDTRELLQAFLQTLMTEVKEENTRRDSELKKSFIKGMQAVKDDVKTIQDMIAEESVSGSRDYRVSTPKRTPTPLFPPAQQHMRSPYNQAHLHPQRPQSPWP